MAEKFQKVVATPEQAAAKLRRKIAETQPVEYVRRKRAEKNANGETGNAAEFVDAAKISMLGAGKWSAWLAAGGAQFLLTLARWLTLDNVFLRQMENKFAVMNVMRKKTIQGKDGRKQTEMRPSKLREFAKKYPNFSAHILWLFGLGLVSGGTYTGVEVVPDVVQTVKERRAERDAVRAAEENARGKYMAFLNKMQPITPFMIADLIAKEGVHVDPATGMHVPYRDSRGIPTIGFGSTVLKDGSRVTMKTAPITTDEAYELARWHLEEGETYFVLYCYDVALQSIDVNTTSEALGMSSLMYNAYTKLIENPNDKNCQNRFNELRNLLKEYGYAVSDDQVRRVFEKYPIQDLTSFGDAWVNNAGVDVMADKLGGFLSGGNGLQWRRWLEAGLLTGDITPQMLLNCPINGMYEFYRVMGRKKSAFFTGDADNRRMNRETLAKFKEWLAHPVTVDGADISGWKKIGDYLPTDILAYCEVGECKLDSKKFQRHDGRQQEIAVKTYTIGYAEQYQNAVAAFGQGDYAGAAQQFEQMVRAYPDNALLRNDLAATYNNLGRYEDAVAQVREILFRIGDKSQYGAAQYNAGFAYEQMGNCERALANYKLAVANGNTRVRDDIARVQQKIKSGKTIAFNDAVKILNDGDKKSTNEFDVYAANHAHTQNA